MLRKQGLQSILQIEHIQTLQGPGRVGKGSVELHGHTAS
jgi:hypothetical protein